MLRAKYRIPESNCVTHAQVSVNPDNMLVGYHTDWSGNFPFLETMITLSAGYGVWCWSFWQDLSQLKAAYPTSWENILNNCGVVQTFGIHNRAMATQLPKTSCIQRRSTGSGVISSVAAISRWSWLSRGRIIIRCSPNFTGTAYR